MTVARYIQVAPESSFGGATSAAFTRIRATGFSDNVNRNATFEEGCDIAAPTYAVAGVYKATGTIDGLLRFSQMSSIINNVLGDTGKLSMSANTSSMKVVIGDDQADDGAGVNIRYEGVAFTSMEFTFAAKEFVKAKYSWVGASAAIDTTTATAELQTDVLPGITYNAVVQAGGSAFNCKSLTLKVDRKIDEDYYFIGSPLLQGIYANAPTDISGTITFGAGEWDNLKKVITGDQDVTITAPALGTTAASHGGAVNELASTSLKILVGDSDASDTQCTFWLANIIMNETTHSVTGRNQWEKTVNYKAYVTSANDFQIAAATS